ncbi:hypothetical protein Hanom_Chr09g00786151 [Helianthus anomalus]
MEVGDDGGSWTDVPNKKDSRNKGREGERKHNGNISKFFITNLPQGCRAWDVVDFVKVFGDVSGSGNFEGTRKEFSFPPLDPKSQHHTSSFQENGKRFSDLFKNEVGSEEGKSKTVVEVGITIDIADETLAFKDLIGRALVGRCKDLRTLRNINTILAENGCYGITLSYLGGLSMFLKFEEDESFINFMLEYQN